MGVLGAFGTASNSPRMVEKEKERYRSHDMSPYIDAYMAESFDIYFVSRVGIARA